MAWTITQTVYRSYNVNILKAEKYIVVKLDCTSDASGTDTELDENIMQKIRGGYVYEMKVVPGSGDDEPSAAWDIDLEDEDNAHVLDTDSNATDAVTFHDGSSTIGHYPVIEESLSFVSGTLGNANTCVVYLKVLK